MKKEKYPMDIITIFDKNEYPVNVFIRLDNCRWNSWLLSCITNLVHSQHKVPIPIYT